MFMAGTDDRTGGMSDNLCFMKKLFGTDGIRGVAGEPPLDAVTTSRIGKAIGSVLRDDLKKKPRVVIGRDTRLSGPEIEASIAAGIRTAGGETVSAGVITTPGVAFLTARFGFDAGIVISASHNPYQDNGIKIFLPSGQKPSEAFERRIEAAVAGDTAAAENDGTPADESRIAEFHAAYLEHLTALAGTAFDGCKFVIDAANGAASEFASRLFRGLGADVVMLGDRPDGVNINKDCGSLHMDRLRAAVVEHKADCGIAFDGDADRCLLVDERGEPIDGDGLLWILANAMAKKGDLANETVVATVMSNIGLEIALNKKGIKLQRAAVGDKFVLEELLATGSSLGGEQSGHIIIPAVSLVGDGMLTALSVVRLMKQKRCSMSESLDGFVRYPQTLLNIPVRKKTAFVEVPEIAEAAAEVERELAGTGRLLLRYSGTEDLARVMIEGQDQAMIEDLARRLAKVITATLV